MLSFVLFGTTSARPPWQHLPSQHPPSARPGAGPALLHLGLTRFPPVTMSHHPVAPVFPATTLSLWFTPPCLSLSSSVHWCILVPAPSPAYVWHVCRNCQRQRGRQEEEEFFVWLIKMRLSPCLKDLLFPRQLSAVYRLGIHDLE